MSHSVCYFVAILTPGVERGIGLVVHHGFGGQVAFADGQWQFLVYKGVFSSLFCMKCWKSRLLYWYGQSWVKVSIYAPNNIWPSSSCLTSTRSVGNMVEVANEVLRDSSSSSVSSNDLNSLLMAIG